MHDHLIFTLAASLGAMGGPVGHERRGTDTWPGRSALIGLLGAALGIRRDGDFTRLDSLKFAVAVFDQGVPLRDFHTAQTIPSAAAKHPQSRPAALQMAGTKVNTVLSFRDYRANPLYGVAATGCDLEELRDALLSPVFTLYLGRKSCPLASPVCPQIIAAEDPTRALRRLVLPPWRRGARAKILAMHDDGGDAGRTMIRYDQPTDRTAWHFSARHERVLAVDIAPEGTA